MDPFANIFFFSVFIMFVSVEVGGEVGYKWCKQNKMKEISLTKISQQVSHPTSDPAYKRITDTEIRSLSCHSTMHGKLGKPFFSFFLPPAVSYSFTTDGYEIFNMPTHLGACRTQEGGVSHKQVCTRGFCAQRILIPVGFFVFLLFCSCWYQCKTE